MTKKHEIALKEELRESEQKTGFLEFK